VNVNFHVVLASVVLAFNLSSHKIAAASEADVVHESYVGSYVRRPTLVVGDLDRALTLYRDILGFIVGSVKQDPPTSYVYTAFNIPSNERVRHATLDADNEKRTLSLVEVKSIPDSSQERGIRTVAIIVNANGRLDEILKQLTAAEYIIMPEGKLVKQAERSPF